MLNTIKELNIFNIMESISNTPILNTSCNISNKIGNDTIINILIRLLKSFNPKKNAIGKYNIKFTIKNLDIMSVLYLFPLTMYPLIVEKGETLIFSLLSHRETCTTFNNVILG